MKRVLIILLAIVFSLSGCSSSEPEHTLEFIEGKTVTVEVNGENVEYIGVFCTYTNNSRETCMPADGINVTAFQHGTELVVNVFTGQKTEGAIQCDTNVQPGTSATVVWLFWTEDDPTVSGEFTDGQEFSFEIE